MRQILFLVMYLMCVESYSQILPWSAERKLTWNDFKEKSMGDTAATAASQVKVTPLKVNIWNGKVTYTAVAQFFSDFSYYDLQKTDDHTLEHEQLHFDITELFARKIRRVIQQKGSMFPRDAQKLFTTYLEELDTWQDRFDEETEHGIKKEEQLKWKNLLSNELKELEN